MKHLAILIMFIICGLRINAQQSQDNAGGDQFASASSRVSPSNLVLFIGPYKVSGAEIENNSTASGPHFYSIQYLYLNNRTVFTIPEKGVRNIEVISMGSNQFRIRIPKLQPEMLVVDLENIRQSIEKAKATVATISFQ